MTFITELLSDVGIDVVTLFVTVTQKFVTVVPLRWLSHWPIPYYGAIQYDDWCIDGSPIPLQWYCYYSYCWPQTLTDFDHWWPTIIVGVVEWRLFSVADTIPLHQSPLHYCYSMLMLLTVYSVLSIPVTIVEESIWLPIVNWPSNSVFNQIPIR